MIYVLGPPALATAIIAAGDSTNIASLAALLTAVVAGLFALLAKLRESRDVRARDEFSGQLGVIHETTDGLQLLVTEQRTELADTRAELRAARVELAEAREQISASEIRAKAAGLEALHRIDALKAEVASMRSELSVALRNHDECEAARGDQEQMISDQHKLIERLQRELGGGQ